MTKEIIEISTDFIKLDSLLKFAAVCGTGGEAKFVISNGDVLVNGTICKIRGKKIQKGDVITIGDDVELTVK